MHVLGWTRAQLYTHPEHVLAPDTQTAFEALVAQRARGAPVAYLTGRKEFFGLAFKVDRRVLIPRPETELLVERALTWARQYVPLFHAPDRSRTGPAAHHKPAESTNLDLDLMDLAVADVGTGSGAVAITIAVQLPRASVYALDTSASALEVAASNIRSHGVEDRVCLLQGDLLAPLPRPVDLIVANLPYIPTAEITTLPREVRDYEPVTALDGGADGLALIREFLRQAPDYVNPAGAVLLEIGATQGPAVASLAREHFPTASIRVIPDYAGRDRVVEILTGKRPMTNGLP